MSFHWLVIPLLVLVVAGIWVPVAYNRFVRLRLRVKESWSNVDTELKRRHNLIPNLVETVKGYARHERSLFEEVTRLRSQALKSPNDSAVRRETEQAIVGALTRLLGVAEAYPQLRASENFLHLQYQLVDTEDRIQASRRFYNGNVRDYNNYVQGFPSNLVARRFRFATHSYFELAEVAERKVPAVQLGSAGI